MKQKTFLPELEAIRKIQTYVSSALPMAFQTPEKSGQIELILEEVVINIVNYAFSDLENEGVQNSVSVE